LIHLPVWMQLYVNDLYGVIRFVKSPKSTGENMLNPGGAVGRRIRRGANRRWFPQLGFPTPAPEEPSN